MIKNLSIQNFQSHKDTELEFHPGVNVIIGTSDSGKSGVIRALRLVINNQPRGDAYRSHWGGDTVIQLEVDDNVITRAKTNSENMYLLNDTEFRAFGNDIPEEIVNVLNIDSSVNIQKQLDQPYLISETPGTVAQHFNRMAQLEKIDSGLKNVQSKIRASEQSIKAKEIELEDSKTKYKSYAYIDELDDKVCKIENSCEEEEKLERDINTLSKIIRAVQELEIDVIEYQKPLKAEKQVLGLIEMREDYKKDLKSFNNLGTAIQNITSTNLRIKKGTKYIEPEKDILAIIELEDSFHEKNDVRDSLVIMIDKIKETEDSIEITKKRLKSREQEYKEEMPEVCPLCNSKIK